MITTTLNATRQTRTLSKTTHAFDEKELEALLNEISRDRQPEVRGTQLLSPEMLVQLLAGSGTPNRKCNENALNIAA